MVSEVSKRLVIDASIARAAGGLGATHPTSKRCRDFLTAVLTICHHVVLTVEITEEWKRHLSGFARKWRVSMEARKKVVRPDPPPSYDELYARIEDLARSFKDREAMYKDFCLVEAALDTDRIVISLDDTVRTLFARVSEHEVELRQVVWVNPDNEMEQALEWLKDGAIIEKHRCLGFHRGDS